MIAHLRGTLIDKAPNRVVLDAGGVGYGVTISVATFVKLGDIGGPAELLIHTHLTDDALTLFGFVLAEERDMFLKLIGISGIGPKLAMNILSGIEPRDLEDAVRRTDVARLTMVPGIGKKTALRIAMELQDKLEKKAQVLAGRAMPEREDLVSALLNMGFRRAEVDRAVDLACAGQPDDAGFEKLLRACLKRLAKV